MKKEIVKGENLLISIVSEKRLDERFGYNMLRNLPVKAGLVPYADPQISCFPNAQVNTEYGITGTIVMIENQITGQVGCKESHCAFHWWADKDYTSVTISSCRKIKFVPVVEFLSEIFRECSISWIITPWPEIE